MKECKKSDYFDLQLLSYFRSDNIIPYGNNKYGMIFVIEQFLLIDEKTSANNEVNNLLKYLDENNLVGNEYNLYIRTDILNSVSGISVLGKAVTLFKSSMYQCDNIGIIVELISSKADENGWLFHIEIVSVT